MNAKDFFFLIKKMRDAQKMYFKTHTNMDLSKAKVLEKKVDNEISRTLSIKGIEVSSSNKLF
jgi:hypothetical protein